MNKLGCALVGMLVAGCTCPGPQQAHAFAPRDQYAAQIDACFAMDIDCQALCRAAFALAMDYAITKCVVTSADDSGVALEVVYFTPCGPD